MRSIAFHRVRVHGRTGRTTWWQGAGGHQHGGRNWKLRAHTLNCKHKVESENWKWCKSLKSQATGHYPTRLHLFIFLRQHHQLGSSIHRRNLERTAPLLPSLHPSIPPFFLLPPSFHLTPLFPDSFYLLNWMVRGGKAGIHCGVWDSDVYVCMWGSMEGDPE